MPGQVGWIKDGVEILQSIDGFFGDALAETAPLAVAKPPTSTALAAALFVLKFFKFLGGDDSKEIRDALKDLQTQIDELKGVVTIAMQRMDEMEIESAIQDNLSLLNELLDHSDEIRLIADRFSRKLEEGTDCLDEANAAGVMADKFLRQVGPVPYYLWCWSDVANKVVIDQKTGVAVKMADRVLHQFKTLITLPIYIRALMLWLGARERVKLSGRLHLLQGDDARLNAHCSATMTSEDFDRFHDDEDRRRPRSLVDFIFSYIEWRIYGSQWPDNQGYCEYAGSVVSKMDGHEVKLPLTRLFSQDRFALCSYRPRVFSGTPEEREVAVAGGSFLLDEVNKILRKIQAGSSLKDAANMGGEPYVGSFDDEQEPWAMNFQATFYSVDQPGNIYWNRVENINQGPDKWKWAGSKRIAEAFPDYIKIFSSLGGTIYAIMPDGTLHWYLHDGFANGMHGIEGPKIVGVGWNAFQHVFSVGDGVVYGVRPNGEMYWYKHNGARYGGDLSTWVQSYEPIRTDLANFRFMDGDSDGVIYGVKNDGTLMRLRHTGYQSGLPSWAPDEQIGTGWADFVNFSAGPGGVLLATRDNGQMKWYRYSLQPEKKVKISGDWVVLERAGERWAGPRDFILFEKTPHGFFVSKPGPVEVLR